LPPTLVSYLAFAYASNTFRRDWRNAKPRNDAFNKDALGELTLRISSRYGSDPDAPDGLRLRSIINDLAERFPSSKKLNAPKVAASSVIELAYVQYSRLSLDAVHCSVTALGRHLSSERTESTRVLTVNVEARIPPAERLNTVLHACRALTGVAVGANELLGFTSASAELAALVAEFEANGWLTNA
jgi:hypothetical protein